MKKSIKSLGIHAAGLLAFALLAGGAAFAGDTGNPVHSEFRIKSRTSYGINLDETYNNGLKQELLDFAYVLHIGPGYVSNYQNSDRAVGFINFSVYDMAITPVSASDGSADTLEGSQGQGSFYDYWDSGKFSAGIAWRNWVLQLNGKNTESFWLPWNKSLEFTDDKIRVSWAAMDTAVGAVRTKHIVDTQPLESDVKGRGVGKYTDRGANYLVQQDDFSMDKLHFQIDGQMIGLMYNQPELFGVDVKFATENSYDSDKNTKNDYNGIAAALDFMVMPPFLPGIRVLGSAGGAWNYGADHNADPFAAGVKVSYTIPVNEDISFEPFAGFDAGFFMSDDNKISCTGNGSLQYAGGESYSAGAAQSGAGGYEASAGLMIRWPGQRGWLTDYISGDEGRVFPGMAMAYSFYTNPDDRDEEPSHSVKFTLFEPTGHDGVLYFIGSEVIADFHNLGTSDWEFLGTAYLDCPIDTIIRHGIVTPFVTAYYDNLPYTDANDDKVRQNAFKTDLGVKLTEAIPNTVLSALWNSGNLIEDKDKGAVRTKGYIRFCAEITF